MKKMKCYFNKKYIIISSLIIFSLFVSSCAEKAEKHTEKLAEKTIESVEQRNSKWKEIELKSDISLLSDNEKEMLRIFINISEIIDNIFWKQNFGDKEEILNTIKGEDSLLFVKINYGPWDVFEGKKSIIPNFNDKSLGSQLYPDDIKYLPFINLKAEGKLSPYTLIERDENGDLDIIPYHTAYNKELNEIYDLMIKASELAENEQFAKYLKLRAEALISDKYLESEEAWMQVKDNKIDFIVGAVETRLDNFFHIKAAYETFLIIRNEELSEKIKVYANLLSDFQKCLPMDNSYKEKALTKDVDFGAYDAVYYAGMSNYGGKMLSLNRPYDIQVIKKFGSKKMMFNNVMDAKLNNILLPISNIMIDKSQAGMPNNKSFSEMNLLYEIGDKLGFNKTLKGVKVSDALKDYYLTIDKTRADLVRLYLAGELEKLGEFNKTELNQFYITYVANIFRYVRFGDGFPEAKASMLIFNYFIEHKAIVRNENGRYLVDYNKMQESINVLTKLIHKIEQEGDYKTAKTIASEKAMIKEPLKTDLIKIQEVPVDVRFKQGKETLGL